MLKIRDLYDIILFPFIIIYVIILIVSYLIGCLLLKIKKMFDKNFYETKKQKLIQKAQQLQQEYLNNAFRFTSEIQNIDLELKEITEWEKENVKEGVKETKQTPKK